MAKKTESYVSLCQKYTLFILNFLFWLVACGVIAVGIIAQLSKTESEIDGVLDVFLNPSIIIIALGAALFLTSFFGCLGSLRENTCLLSMYQILTTILLLAQLALVGVFLLFFYVPSLRETISVDKVLREAIIRYRDDLDLKDTIDTMQKTFKCCGASNDENGYVDWNYNVYFNCSASVAGREKCGVPYSCCIPGEVENLQCGDGVRTGKTASELSTIIYTQGCVRGIFEFFRQNLLLVVGVCVGVLVAQIIVICLAKSLKEQILDQKARYRQYDAGSG